MALRKAASSSIFAFLKHKPSSSLTTTTPFISRRFSTDFSFTNWNDETCNLNTHGGSMNRSSEFPVRRGISDQLTEHPWLVEGQPGLYDAKKVEEGLLLRVDMPGISKDEIKYWVEENSVFIKGEGRKKSEFESSGRTYSGSIDLCLDVFRIDQIKAEMKNGVLRMLIPMKKSVPSRSSAFQNQQSVLSCNCNRLDELEPGQFAAKMHLQPKLFGHSKQHRVESLLQCGGA